MAGGCQRQLAETSGPPVDPDFVEPTALLDAWHKVRSRCRGAPDAEETAACERREELSGPLEASGCATRSTQSTDIRTNGRGARRLQRRLESSGPKTRPDAGEQGQVNCWVYQYARQERIQMEVDRQRTAARER